MDIPQSIKNILDLFSGYTTYIYGRALREILMGAVPGKCRIITAAPVSVLRKIFPGATIIKGRMHVLADKIDCTVISAIPDAGALCTTQDFTIDSAAYSEVTGLIDICGAKEDIENKIIRLRDNTTESIYANPAVMVKAVRHCAELGFTLADDTRELIAVCAVAIKQINCRSVLHELERLLLSPRPDYFRMLHELGLLKYLIPQLDRCFGEPQKNKYHIHDVGEHIMCAVKNTPRDYVLRWSALLHDVGKPCCSSTDNNGIIHFYGHHRESRLIADDILHRYGIESDNIRSILTLIENHDVRVEPSHYQVKKMMLRTGGVLFEKLMQLQTADNMAKNPKYFTEKYRRINAAAKIARQVMESGEPYRYEDLKVNAKDLQKQGIRPGRETTELMRALMDEVIAEPEKNSYEYLLRRVRELRK